MCAVSTKVMVPTLALVVFIQLWWWHCGKSEGLVHSLLGGACGLVVEVGQFVSGIQEKKFAMIDFQFESQPWW